MAGELTRVVLGCPLCAKVFEKGVDEEGTGIETTEDVIEALQGRLGQHIWSSHGVDCREMDEVEAQVIKANKKNATPWSQKAPQARSRSPVAASANSKGSTSAVSAASLTRKRVNMCTLAAARVEMDINLADCTMKHLEDLNRAVQNELKLRLTTR